MNKFIIRFFILSLVVVSLFETHDPDIGYASLLGAALVTGGLGLLGSMYGAHSANSSNLQAARETNAMQYRMFQEANDFNRQERLETQEYNRNLWYEQQKYNSPVEQAMRYRAAGLNPALALGGETASAPISSSPASSASIPSLATPSFENPMSNFGSIMSPISDAMLKNAQTESIMIDNETRSRKNLLEVMKYESELESMLENRNLSKSQRRKIESDLDTARLQRGIFELQADQMRFSTQHQEQDWQMFRQKMIDDHNESTYRQSAQKIANDIAQATGMKIANAQLSQIYQSIRESSQSVENMKESKKLTHAQTLHEYEKKAETLARRLGISSQNKHFNSVKNYIKSEMQLVGERAGDTNRMRSDRLARSIDNVNNLFGLGVLRGSLK